MNSLTPTWEYRSNTFTNIWTTWKENECLFLAPEVEIIVFRSYIRHKFKETKWLLWSVRRKFIQKLYTNNQMAHQRKHQSMLAKIYSWLIILHAWYWHDDSGKNAEKHQRCNGWVKFKRNFYFSLKTGMTFSNKAMLNMHLYWKCLKRILYKCGVKCKMLELRCLRKYGRVFCKLLSKYCTKSKIQYHWWFYFIITKI